MSATPLAAQPVPTPIQPPPTFPVTWEDVDDSRLFWTIEREHAPDPLTPLEEWYVRSMFDDGLNPVGGEYGWPPMKARRINTYVYAAELPLDASSGDAAGRGQEGEAQLRADMAGLGDAWNGTLLPEIRRHLAAWEAFDLVGASVPALLAHLDETVTRWRRLMELHFRIVLPAYGAIRTFASRYRDLLDDPDEFAAYRLLQGFDNKTLAGNRALWQLSRRARAMPAVRRALRETATAQVPAALQRSGAGREFLAELHAFLDEYGHRGDKWQLSCPYWIEDPTPVVKNLKDYLRQPDRDPAAAMAALAAERERLVAETRARLHDHPPAVTEQFERLLHAAQVATVLTEDHDYWIDGRGAYQVRRVLLAFGRRFAAAGILDQSDDVFYLTLQEVGETAAAGLRPDRRRLVSGRRAELEYFRTITPPPALGTPPAGPPPGLPADGSDSLTSHGVERPSQPPGESAAAVVVRGTAASPGVARGPAKIVRALVDAAKIQPGDVLVAETTAPPWTPLFATAAAIVTDSGGILSHGAIVAREYGIPAVVGTGDGTTRLRDGQLVEVDGGAGVVRIL